MLATRRIPTDSLNLKKHRLREIIRERSLLRDKEFLLASGELSNYYFNMKKTTLDPEGISLVADLLFARLRDTDFQFLGGLETGAIPIVTAISMRSWPERPINSFFVRDRAKDHGTRDLIDGFIEDGARVIIVDDVTTKGNSAMKAVQAVRNRHCVVVKVISIVDRLEGAYTNFEREGIPFEPLFTTRDFD